MSVSARGRLLLAHGLGTGTLVIGALLIPGEALPGQLASIPARNWPLTADRGRDASALLAGLALGAGAAAALLLRSRSRRERLVLAAMRRDGPSALLSRFALEHDLQHQAAATAAPGPSPVALLVTVHCRCLGKQRLLMEPTTSIAAILSVLHRDLGAALPPGWSWSGYRAGDDALALRVGLGPNNPLLDPTWCQSWLERVRAIAAEVCARFLAGAGQGEDIRIVAQYLRGGESAQAWLRLQTFGETLADEHPRALHLLGPGDRRRLKADDAIQRALLGLGAEDLELRFQPILLLANPGHIGLELLLRFRPPGLAKLGTEAVFQRAMAMGIAHRIDALLLERLAGVREALQELGPLAARIDYISVNVSSASVATPQRLAELIGLLRAHRVDASLFCLELTETAATDLVKEQRSLVSTSQRLMNELDFRLFIDDFGSGLSNYRRVSEAWYDTIKLDRGLVRGIGRSFRLQRFVGSLITTVHQLGKTVIAEGVENHRDLAVMLRLGADAVQGYLIARPMPWWALASFLQDSPWTSPAGIAELQAELRAADRGLALADPEASGQAARPDAVPLERYILDNWSTLRSFEEFVLLFVQELRAWGLEVLRLSLAFLPDQDDIDCSQYVWQRIRPGEVTTLRMQRDFLETEEHLASPLHFLANRSRILRQRLAAGADPPFPFLKLLQAEGGSDYLGLRLDSRGISIPVLSVCLAGSSRFSEQQVERIEAMSSLLSLLFHAYESERSKRLALLDALTQLPNRRRYDSQLQAALVASATARSPLALALIDIDRFKAVNDTMGHAYGDTCLIQVAKLLAQHLQRENDLVARLGGEEFGVIFSQTDATNAARICEQVRVAVAGAGIHHPSALCDHRLTISIGLAVWCPQTSPRCDADALQQLADDCLYAAKHQGRNRLVVRQLDPA
ncbi:EAL domain-containing protein [Vulcanococcus limneticus]|uniref:EAL domain-containing protein n=1 Tax=Vulcanococcus limneticus TaxID=2170428 RepID=UPI00398BE228